MKISFINRKVASSFTVLWLLLVALVPVFAYSLEITLKTDKPSYHGSEYVYVSGLLTYNYWPITNELVSVEVLDSQNLTMLIVTRLTDSEGKYNYTFRLPDSAKTGTYTVKVVAEHFELIARNQAIFEVTSSNAIYIRADGSIEPTPHQSTPKTTSPTPSLATSPRQ